MLSVVRDNRKAMHQRRRADEKVHWRQLLTYVSQCSLNFAESASHVGRDVENNNIVQ